ncbi:MAG: adenine-specific methyltransferase EcoRI family protein [Planctomycetaceae bacterium]|nr:adenine-specific methyltransferase EcoRI family protein [Planctomycetaceae bacterium]
MAKKSGNTNSVLRSAKVAKNDEFYTQLLDIENELKHYWKHFTGKTVLCNCDDPRESMFVKYFFDHFSALGLQRLIATCYKNPSTDLFSTHTAEQSLWLDYTGEGRTNDENPDRRKMKAKKFKDDGDFRSDECIALLKQADIVCTNPPFSLFREYVAQLIEYNKSFLIIGNYNAISYKEIFPLIKGNKMWLGYGFSGGNAYFSIPEDYSNTQIVFVNGKRLCKFRSCCWFTNLDHDKRHENLELYKTYNPAEYLKYDHYNAIEVSKTAEIPKDYNGVMGVPLTFLDKYNPEQFEILGDSRYITGACFDVNVVNGKTLYRRLLIRRKQE